MKLKCFRILYITYITISVKVKRISLKQLNIWMGKNIDNNLSCKDKYCFKCLWINILTIKEAIIVINDNIWIRSWIWTKLLVFILIIKEKSELEFFKDLYFKSKEPKRKIKTRKKRAFQ